MDRTTAEYGVVRDDRVRRSCSANPLCVRFAPRHSLEKLIWFGLALQFLPAALLNLIFNSVAPAPIRRRLCCSAPR